MRTTVAKNTPKLEQRVLQVASGSVAVFVVATVFYFVIRTIIENI